MQTPTAEAAPPPEAPTADDLFRTAGFLAARDQIMGAVQQAGAIKTEVYDATIEYLENAQARGELENAPPQVLDDLDTQLRAVKAVRVLRMKLAQIDKASTARAALRA